MYSVQRKLQKLVWPAIDPFRPLSYLYTMLRFMVKKIIWRGDKGLAGQTMHAKACMPLTLIYTTHSIYGVCMLCMLNSAHL